MKVEMEVQYRWNDVDTLTFNRNRRTTNGTVLYENIPLSRVIGIRVDEECFDTEPMCLHFAAIELDDGTTIRYSFPASMLSQIMRALKIQMPKHFSRYTEIYNNKYILQRPNYQ